MSERRKISLQAPRPETGDAPRKPVRSGAPVVRNRVRAAEPEAPARTERASPPDRPRAPPRARDRAEAPPSEARRDDRAPVRRNERPAPDDGRVRLSKVMSERGIASRREADQWITEGWVSVDGVRITELGTRIFPNQAITIDEAARVVQSQLVTILLNKPIGYVSGQAEDGYEPAVVLVRPENRWEEDRLPWKLSRGHLHKLAPAGRLDIDSTGLLVLTQDGRVARHLIGEDALVEKEYLVRVVSMAEPDAENVSAVVPEEALEQMRYGLSLDGRPLKPAKVSWQNEQQLRFVLREGKKRQIRRMCEMVGLKVVGLRRVRMGQVVLGKLPVGQWRFLRPDERF